jgi:hypothetical protein
LDTSSGEASGPEEGNRVEPAEGEAEGAEGYHREPDWHPVKARRATVNKRDLKTR